MSAQPCEQLTQTEQSTLSGRLLVVYEIHLYGTVTLQNQISFLSWISRNYISLAFLTFQSIPGSEPGSQTSY